jgi:hypothetical protein
MMMKFSHSRERHRQKSAKRKEVNLERTNMIFQREVGSAFNAKIIILRDAIRASGARKLNVLKIMMASQCICISQ